MVRSNRKLILFIAAHLLNSFFSDAQVINVNWNQTYGGNSRDWNNQLLRNQSGDLFIIGDSKTEINGDKTEPLCSAGSDHSDIWLIKADSTGNIIWQKNYGAESNEVNPKLLLLNNPAGEMIFTCFTNSNIACDKSEPNRDTIPLLSPDFWIVKLDSNGVILWEKTIGGDNIDEYNNIAILSNGNVVIAGESNSPVGYDKTVPNYSISKDSWVITLDPAGNKIADYVFGGSGGEFLASIIPDSNGGFLLAGSSNSGISGDVSEPGQGNYDFWMIKIDDQGTKVWDKRFGGTGPDICNHAIFTNNGGYVLTGYTVSPQGGDVTEAPRGLQDYWIIRTDASGNKIWDKRFGGDGGSFGTHITEDSQGALWVSGYTNSTAINDVSENSYGGSDYWHLKIDASGNKIQDKRFGGSGNDFARGLNLINDSTLLLFGYSDTGSSPVKTAVSKGWYDFWILSISVQDTSTGIQHFNDTEIEFSVYPNPATDLIKLNFVAENSGNRQVLITDLAGRQVMQTELKHSYGFNSHTIDISGLNRGVYLITMRQDSKSIVRKLIKNSN